MGTSTVVALVLRALVVRSWALPLVTLEAVGASPTTKAADSSARCLGSWHRGLQREHAMLQTHRDARLLSLAADDGDDELGRVTPFNCAAYRAPIQVMEALDEQSISIRMLDVHNGSYETLYRIPMSRTDPPFERMNACGIGPVDGMAYCEVHIGDQSFLTRFDSENVDFVAKLPRRSWKATFDSKGAFCVAIDPWLYKLADVHLLPGYASPDDERLAGSERLERIAVGSSGYDIVTVLADLEGTGSQEYIVSVAGPKVIISRITGEAKTWELNREDPDMRGSKHFGAGWNYANRIFFASNNGNGIYEVDLDSVDLEASSVRTRRVGPSVETHRNDGMNCMAQAVPEFWVEGSCMIWGEPHVRVFDGGAAAVTDSEGVVDMLSPGDFWIVRSEEISVQGRYLPTPWSNGRAAMSALAIGGGFLKGHTLIVESMDGRVWWDGQEILNATPSEFLLPDLLSARFHEAANGSSLDPGQMQAVAVKTVELELRLGTRLTVNRWAKHIDVMITMLQQPRGQDGHCGNFNGNISDDTQELIQQRMGEQVRPDDLLFVHQEEVVEAPALEARQGLTLDDCPEALQARAEALCNGLGEGGSGSGSGSMVLRSCVFDACFGGEEFAAADAALSQQMAGNPSPASIHWATNPGLCLDVGGGQPQNGSVLQVWECITGHADMQFLLPMGGVGQIRWATFPKMCLDVAQGSSELGTRVQFWECEAGHRNMQFIVPAGGKGKIRWSADATLCLDVQDGGVAMGTHIQLWTCMGEGQANQEFEVAFTTPGA